MSTASPQAASEPKILKFRDRTAGLAAASADNQLFKTFKIAPIGAVSQTSHFVELRRASAGAPASLLDKNTTYASMTDAGNIILEISGNDASLWIPQFHEIGDRAADQLIILIRSYKPIKLTAIRDFGTHTHERMFDWQSIVDLLNLRHAISESRNAANRPIQIEDERSCAIPSWMAEFNHLTTTLTTNDLLQNHALTNKFEIPIDDITTSEIIRIVHLSANEQHARGVAIAYVQTLMQKSRAITFQARLLPCYEANIPKTKISLNLLCATGTSN
jgi:hypothetical protein